MNFSSLTTKVGEILFTGLGGSRLDDDARCFMERRAYTRARFRFQGTVDVEGQRIPVRGIDLHRAGARILADQTLPEGAVVFFFAKSHGLMGWASVRWGAWRGPKYHAGLEFRHPLMRAEAGEWQFSCVQSPSPAAAPQA